MVGTRPICGLPTPPCAVDNFITLSLVVPQAPERGQYVLTQRFELMENNESAHDASVSQGNTFEVTTSTPSTTAFVAF